VAAAVAQNEPASHTCKKRDKGTGIKMRPEKKIDQTNVPSLSAYLLIGSLSSMVIPTIV
jgi:hypothetical protein